MKENSDTNSVCFKNEKYLFDIQHGHLSTMKQSFHHCIIQNII